MTAYIEEWQKADKGLNIPVKQEKSKGKKEVMQRRVVSQKTQKKPMQNVIPKPKKTAKNKQFTHGDDVPQDVRDFLEELAAGSGRVLNLMDI